ncbi:branched-chain amino acid ABC transporter permease [Streptomyces brasiliensis]|uniref:Branched-chain amino acid ABC transporter permease n=1 Tax=Streptomyces brasiliensis TaxID=1954 RepID=A0A917ULA6_9ACTN|nr:branched-chain amino acid ABC transporter permease [Streptomyces brasiliensis]GGJ65655.1 branched-chain amino acid ABC transporter permease [Streptomyces brasiliensis]
MSDLIWKRSGIALVAVLLLAVPFILENDMLGVAIVCLAYAVAAIGLTVLVGVGGQLSLAHGFFVAVGAYAYTVFGSPKGEHLFGFGLPPLIAAIGAVVVAAFAGLAFSPIARRLGGLYLGMASLALVFIADYVFQRVGALSGGSGGRMVPAFTVGGLQLSGFTKHLWIAGVDFGGMQRLWYLVLIVAVLSAVAALRIVRGRPGQALQLMRDNPAAAAAMGVNIPRAKSGVFVMSSAYAGLAGVLIALQAQTVVPHTFSMTLSLNLLVMIILGGLGSVQGAVVGAVVVNLLPAILDKLGTSGALAFIDPTGVRGMSGGLFSALVFGAAVVLVLIFEPLGLAGLFRRAVRRASITRAG